MEIKYRVSTAVLDNFKLDFFASKADSKELFLSAVHYRQIESSARSLGLWTYSDHELTNSAKDRLSDCDFGLYTDYFRCLNAHCSDNNMLFGYFGK